MAKGAVAYQLFESTSLSVNGGQSVGNSVLEGLFIQTRSVSCGLRQRLFRNLFLEVQPGYTFNKYRSTGKGFEVQRSDDFLSVYAALSTMLWKRLDVSLFYQFNDNSSTDQNATFNSTQVGLRLAYRY